VPYAGTAPALNALLGDHVVSVYSDHGSLGEQLRAGKVRALATAAHARIDTLPDVPTLAESGFKDYEADIWFGVVAPAKTPPEALSQLAVWFTGALQAPEVKSKLAIQHFTPTGRCGAEFAAHLRRQYDDFGRVIREAGIKAE
jgi:tripartite-type tricarboxylate transporter receptor subunit TctC